MNYILIGMSGCGKTTVGRALAEALGFTFVDLDEEIERRQGKSIVQIFQEVGEVGFRKLESEELARWQGTQNMVIATGGGVVTQPRNLPVLKELGKVIFLNRSLQSIAQTIQTSTRPMLHKDDTALQRLYDERLPLYRSCADVEINADGSVEEVVKAITF